MQDMKRDMIQDMKQDLTSVSRQQVMTKNKTYWT